MHIMRGMRMSGRDSTDSTTYLLMIAILDIQLWKVPKMLSTYMKMTMILPRCITTWGGFCLLHVQKHMAIIRMQCLICSFKRWIQWWVIRMPKTKATKDKTTQRHYAQSDWSGSCVCVWSRRSSRPIACRWSGWVALRIAVHAILYIVNLPRYSVWGTCFFSIGPGSPRDQETYISK